MARLIDAYKITDELRAYADRKCANGYMDTANGILSAVNYIRNNVTRVDAAELVRCKDCKFGTHFGDLEDEWIYCGNLQGKPLMPFDGFCSYGERKDNCGTRLEDVKK